jgi:subtilase family serine protease
MLALASSGALAYTMPNTFERQKHIAQLSSQTDMNQQREFTVFLRPGASADTVASYFRTFGFQAEYVPVTNSIRLKGSFRQAERAGSFSYVTGRLAITPLRTGRKPSFPAAVQSAILVTNFERGPVLSPDFTLNPINNSTMPVHDGVPGLAPSDYGAIYDINPLYKTGINGKGQTVDIAAAFGYNTTALHNFQLAFGLKPAPSVSPETTNLPRSSSFEPDLDVQRVYGTAPGAAIRMWFTKEATLGDFVNLFNDIAADQVSHPAVAMSVSYSLPENIIGSLYASLFTAADKALHGITGTAQKVALFNASGDRADNSGTYASGETDVEFFASDSNVLAVGGTTLYLNKAFLRSQELAWTESGGGVSNVFGLPPWQSGVTGLIDTKHKNLPDLANSSGGGSPALTWLIQPKMGINGLQGIFGTSAATPTMAGITALLKQKRGFPSGGWPKFFYSHAADFVDITVGSNGKYQAKPGWDAVTGLGVPDVNKLATAR